MSSINPYFTFHYSQPEDYRFSHDSVFLARNVFDHVRGENLQDYEVLDLCAGCGIIGLDFLFHCRKELGFLPRRCDFLEVQSVYEMHFQKNAETFSKEHTRFLNHNYDSLARGELVNQYDLILCNPPYFLADHGKLSSSEFKNRCRFFIDSDFPTLLSAIRNALKPNGQAFVLASDRSAHGYDPLREAAKEFADTLTIEPWGEIRGTRVVKVSLNRVFENKY